LARPEDGTRLARTYTPVYAVRVGGGNAGHTVIGRCPSLCDGSGHQPDASGRTVLNDHAHPWRLRQLPTAAVSNQDAYLVIAAGSEIEPAVLESEVNELEAAGYHVRGRLLVDDSCTVVTRAHQNTESGGGLATLFGDKSLVERIGSTGKGIGAARADRLMRKAQRWTDLGSGQFSSYDTAAKLRGALRSDDARVIVEGTQGYGLGLHTRYYPQVTSSDCRAIDFLAMAGLSPWDRGVSLLEVYLVCRTFPIRVAGNSGPLLGETTWSALGLSDEYTTVTKKVRRVGGWDLELVREAVDANGGGDRVQIALTMLDQMHLDVAGQTEWSGLPRPSRDFVTAVAAKLATPVTLLGTGPDTLVDLR
jgi:adenylosuccinate synthase